MTEQTEGTSMNAHSTSPSCCNAIQNMMQHGLIDLHKQSSGIWMLKTSETTEIRVAYCPSCGKFWEPELLDWKFSESDQALVSSLFKELRAMSGPEALETLVSRFGESSNHEIDKDDTVHSFHNALETGVLNVQIRRGRIVDFYPSSYE